MGMRGYDATVSGGLSPESVPVMQCIARAFGEVEPFPSRSARAARSLYCPRRGSEEFRLTMLVEDRDPRSELGARAFWTGLLLATLVGGAIRLHDLGSASLWADEIFMVRSTLQVCDWDFSNKTLGYVPTSLTLSAFGVPCAGRSLSNNARWQELGVTAFRARLASALVGILTLPILGLAGRRLLGARGSLWLVGLLAFAPWHVQWSQTARFYSQQFLFYNLALLGYYTAVVERSTRHLAAAVAAAVAAVFTQPTALLLLPVLGADFALAWARGRRPRISPLGWGCVALALALCAWVLVGQHLGEPEDLGAFAEKRRGNPLKVLAKIFFRVDPAILLLAASGALVQLRSRRTGFLLLAALVPPAVVGLLGTRLWVADRYAFVCLFAWLALAALAAQQLYDAARPRLGRIAAAAPVGLAVLSMLTMGFVAEMSTRGMHPRWREAYAWVGAQRRPGEWVYSNPVVARYYLQTEEVRPLRRIGPAALREELASRSRAAWVVREALEPGAGKHGFLAELGSLQAVFPMRGAWTRHEVYVYRIPGPDEAGSSGSASGNSGLGPFPTAQR